MRRRTARRGSRPCCGAAWPSAKARRSSARARRYTAGDSFVIPPALPFWVAARDAAATVLITVLPPDDVLAVPLR
jgi:quercetin dioxygenase-like cupin family protein